MRQVQTAEELARQEASEQEYMENKRPRPRPRHPHDLMLLPLGRRILLTMALMGALVFLLQRFAAPPSLSSSRGIDYHHRTEHLPHQPPPQDSLLHTDIPCMTSWNPNCPVLHGPYFPTPIDVQNKNARTSLPRLALLRYLTNPIPGVVHDHQMLQNLQFVLEHEFTPPPPSSPSSSQQPHKQQFIVHKHWMLYRIADPILQAECIKLLQKYQQSYHVVPFDNKVYHKIKYTFAYATGGSTSTSTAGAVDVWHHHHHHRHHHVVPNDDAKQAILQGAVLHDKAQYVWNLNQARNELMEYAIQHFTTQGEQNNHTYNANDKDSPPLWLIPADPETFWSYKTLHTVATALAHTEATTKYVVIPRQQVATSNGKFLKYVQRKVSSLPVVQYANDDKNKDGGSSSGRGALWAEESRTMRTGTFILEDRTAQLIQYPYSDYQLVLRSDAMGRFHPRLRPGRHDVQEFYSRLRVDGYGWWNVTTGAGGWMPPPQFRPLHRDASPYRDDPWRNISAGPGAAWLPWEKAMLEATAQQQQQEAEGSSSSPGTRSVNHDPEADPWRLSVQAPPLDAISEHGNQQGSLAPLIGDAVVVRLYTSECSLVNGRTLRSATHALERAIVKGMAEALAVIDFQVARQIDKFSPNPTNALLFFHRGVLQYEARVYREAQFQAIYQMEKRIQSLVWMVYKLIEAARDAHRSGPWSVTDKPSGWVAPSGDPHDYFNVASDFHPPILDDGSLGYSLPYVATGRRNQAASDLYAPRSERYDATRFTSMVNNVTVLTLASYFTKQDVHAQHAVKLLKRWFWDNETMMNPHMDFASVRPNHDPALWRGEHVTDLLSIYYLLDIAQLLEEGGYFTDRQVKLFQKWMKRFLVWLQTSEQGLYAASSDDYHGIYYDIMCVAIANYLQDYAKALQYFHMAAGRFHSHFNEHYQMIQALKNPKDCENEQMQTLNAWHILGRMAEHMGVFDLWREKVPKSPDTMINDDILDLLRMPEDPLYNSSVWQADDALPVLCAASVRAIPFILNRPMCGKGQTNAGQDAYRWWPLLDGYRRQCEDWPVLNANGTSWMRPTSARDPPSNRYHMPFSFPPNYNFAPFWNLGYRVKPRA